MIDALHFTAKTNSSPSLASDDPRVRETSKYLRRWARATVACAQAIMRDNQANSEEHPDANT